MKILATAEPLPKETIEFYVPQDRFTPAHSVVYTYPLRENTPDNRYLTKRDRDELIDVIDVHLCKYGLVRPYDEVDIHWNEDESDMTITASDWYADVRGGDIWHHIETSDRHDMFPTGRMVAGKVKNQVGSLKQG